MLDLDNTLVDRRAAVRAWTWEFVGEWDLPVEAHGWILDQDQDGYANRRKVLTITIGSLHELAAAVAPTAAN